VIEEALTHCGLLRQIKKKNLHGPFRLGSVPKGCVPLIYTYSKCKLSINRLSGCHTVPKGVTALLSVLG